MWENRVKDNVKLVELKKRKSMTFGGIYVRSEEEKPALTANWEMQLWIQGGNNEYYPADIIGIDDWIPVTVDTNGKVSIDYTYADPRYAVHLSDTHTATHHIKAAGTYLDDRLEISGTWFSDLNWKYPSGACEKIGFHRVNGNFKLAGHYTLGFFFNEPDARQVTASVQYEETQTCYDSDGEVQWKDVERHDPSGLTPYASIDDFRRK